MGEAIKICNKNFITFRKSFETTIKTDNNKILIIKLFNKINNKANNKILY